MRCAVTPGNRAMESAMLVSGSLPMSSALTTSTTEVDSRFVAIDASIEYRMPLTTTSSMASSLVFASCARATPLLPASTAATAAATEFTAKLPLYDEPRRNPCPVRIFIVIPPTSGRLGGLQVQRTCSESGSFQLNHSEPTAAGVSIRHSPRSRRTLRGRECPGRNQDPRGTAQSAAAFLARRSGLISRSFTAWLHLQERSSRRHICHSR